MLTGTGVVARYGNDAADVHVSGETAAVAAVYALAQPGALLITGNTNTPWKYPDYEKHRYEILSTLSRDHPSADDLASFIAGQSRSRSQPSFVLLTARNNNSARMFGTMPAGVLAGVQEDLRANPRFAVIYDSPQATLFKYVGPLTSP